MKCVPQTLQTTRGIASVVTARITA